MGFQTSERGDCPTVWHIGPRVRRVRAPENVRIRRSVGVENARKPKGAVKPFVHESAVCARDGKKTYGRQNHLEKNIYLKIKVKTNFKYKTT